MSKKKHIVFQTIVKLHKNCVITPLTKGEGGALDCLISFMNHRGHYDTKYIAVISASLRE
jgi:hypothetical protein